MHLDWASKFCLHAEKQRGRMFSVDEKSLFNPWITCSVFTVCCCQLCCVFVWKQSSILGQPLRCLLHSRIHLFLFIPVLCHLCFLFWCFNIFKSPAMFRSLFPMIDSFVGQAQDCFTTENPSLFLSVRPDGFGVGCQGCSGSCWLDFMAVIERECLKSWHFTSARDKMTDWAVPLCLCLSSSSSFCPSATLFHFRGSFINLTCDTINWKLKGTKWVTSTSQ